MYIHDSSFNDASQMQGVGEPDPRFQLQPPTWGQSTRPGVSFLPPLQLAPMPGQSVRPSQWPPQLYPPQSPGRPLQLFPPLVPPLGPFPELVIDGFAIGATNLNQAQAARVQRFAQQVGARPSPFTTAVRFVSFRAPGEANIQTGMARAQQVQAAFERELCRANQLVASALRLHRNDCGISQQGARIEVYTTVVRGASPVSPCLVQNEQAVPTLFCTAPPLRPQGRSFSQAFWQMLEGRLNTVMNDLRVPASWRGHIRSAARDALEKGAEEILTRALATTPLNGEAREAISAAVRAAAQTPVP